MDGYIVYVLRGVMPQRSFECNDIVLFEYFAKKIVRPYVTFLAPVSHSALLGTDVELLATHMKLFFFR